MNSAGFDSIAPFYPWMEWILAGRTLQKARVQYLGELEQPRRVLLLGEGHGRFLSECRLRWPGVGVVVVERSLAMMVEARKRLRASGLEDEGIEWVQASVEDWLVQREGLGEADVDVVVTHFFLDCFEGERLERCVRGISRAVCRKSRWLVADFQIPNIGAGGGWRAVRARWIHAWMYAFFRRVTGLEARRWEDPSPLLESEGFRLGGRRTYEWGLVRSDQWERRD